MKHFVILIALAVAVASGGCAKRYSDYGYQAPGSAPAQEQQK